MNIHVPEKEGEGDDDQTPVASGNCSGVVGGRPKEGHSKRHWPSFPPSQSDAGGSGAVTQVTQVASSKQALLCRAGGAEQSRSSAQNGRRP